MRVQQRWAGIGLAVALAGCATQGDQEKAGMVIGGVVGVVVGAPIVDGLTGGKRETLLGNACRQADGSWRVVN
jgi:surface antigen